MKNLDSFRMGSYCGRCLCAECECAETIRFSVGDYMFDSIDVSFNVIDDDYFQFDTKRKKALDKVVILNPTE